MPAKTFPTITDLHALLHHARCVIQELRLNLERGARPDLATAMALTALDAWRLATTPKKERDPLEREKLAICEALTLAIHHYSEPDLVNCFGADQAAARRDLFMQILVDLTGS